MIELPQHASIARAQKLLTCDLAGEAVLLQPVTGHYFGLNRVGTAIWNLLEKPCTLDKIHQTLVQTFDVAPEACHGDMLEFLHKLDRAGLIEVRSALAA